MHNLVFITQYSSKTRLHQDSDIHPLCTKSKNPVHTNHPTRTLSCREKTIIKSSGAAPDVLHFNYEDKSSWFLWINVLNESPPQIVTNVAHNISPFRLVLIHASLMFTQSREVSVHSAVVHKRRIKARDSGNRILY